VANRASRAQGSAWLTAAHAAIPLPAIAALRTRVLTEGLPGHQAPLVGAITAALGVASEQALRLVLFQHLRSLVSSAVRLSLVGPLAAQALQARCAEVAEGVLARCRDLAPEDAASTVPLLDCWHGQHDRLYSRLFAS
jgi:urease accessory protein